MHSRASISFAACGGMCTGSVAPRMPCPNSTSRAQSGAARPRMLAVRSVSSSPNWEE